MIAEDKLRTKEMDCLFDAILTLENREEAYAFFEDLCTVGELQSMKQRFQVARMLKKGNSYQEIEAEAGASSATISRVNRSLNYGKDGYDIVLGRMEE